MIATNEAQLALNEQTLARLELEESGEGGDGFGQPDAAQGVPVAAGAQIATAEGVLV